MEVGGKQILWAASERACQGFDKVNASTEILRDHSLDLRETGTRVFCELFVTGGLVWKGCVSLIPQLTDVRCNDLTNHRRRSVSFGFPPHRRKNYRNSRP